MDFNGVLEWDPNEEDNTVEVPLTTPNQVNPKLATIEKLYKKFSPQLDRDTLSPRPKMTVFGIAIKSTSLNGKTHLKCCDADGHILTGDVTLQFLQLHSESVSNQDWQENKIWRNL